MSTTVASQFASWDEQELERRRGQRSRLKAIFHWVLILTVIVLGIWVLVLTFSHEPGVYLQFDNQSGQVLKEVRVSLSWCDYVHAELTTESRKPWWKPYIAVLQRVGNASSKTTDVKVVWKDAKGVQHQHVQKEVYLGMQAELLLITFHADGSVTVKSKGLSIL